MQNKLGKLIKIVYKKWRSDNLKVGQLHPDEESMACFLEGKLSAADQEQIKLHLLSCDSCAEAFAMQINLKDMQEKAVPQELLARVKNLVTPEDKIHLLEILLRLKENLLELVNTTGDILLGQELVPAPVLRSRKIKDFKDEITIFKDFKDIRVQIKIENKSHQLFDLIITVTEKRTAKLLKDLRITLLKDDLELESYLADTGKVTFEHVLLGKYTVEISNIENKLASILLDIKI